jgi:hypothetical protein
VRAAPIYYLLGEIVKKHFIGEMSLTFEIPINGFITNVYSLPPF